MEQQGTVGEAFLDLEGEAARGVREARVAMVVSPGPVGETLVKGGAREPPVALGRLGELVLRAIVVQEAPWWRGRVAPLGPVPSAAAVVLWIWMVAAT